MSLNGGRYRGPRPLDTEKIGPFISFSINVTGADNLSEYRSHQYLSCSLDGSNEQPPLQSWPAIVSDAHPNVTHYRHGLPGSSLCRQVEKHCDRWLLEYSAETSDDGR